MSFYILAIFGLLLAQSSHAQEVESSDHHIWRQAIGGSAIGQPLAQVESVVVLTDGGNLRSYSSAGTPLWDYYARGRLAPHVSRSREGTTYICRTNGILIAINRIGRELWQTNLRSPIVTPVLFGWDGRLFIFTSREIICTTASGYQLWSRALNKTLAIAPIIDATGGFIMVFEDGEVVQNDPFGNILSHTAAGTAPIALASLEDEEKLHRILIFFEDRHFEVFNGSLNGEASFRGSLNLPAPPLATTGRGNQAALLSRDGKISLFSFDEKQVLWTEDSHIRTTELPNRAGTGREALDLFFDERGIYILTKTGATGFTSDGRRLWTIRLTGTSSVPAFGDDGILFSGSNDWTLNAYFLEDRGRDTERLLYGEAPPGRYNEGNLSLSFRADYYFFSELELEARFAEIRRDIMYGTVGANEKEHLSWLMETAGSLASNPRAGNHPPVHVIHRIEAARILGYIGSCETIPFLADLFIMDPEPYVKAAAAESIGRIGVDPEGIALRAFQSVVLPPMPNMDETVLTAVAAATGALCRFSGPPVSLAGVRLLTFILTDEKPPGARRQAQREISSLR